MFTLPSGQGSALLQGGYRSERHAAQELEVDRTVKASARLIAQYALSSLVRSRF